MNELQRNLKEQIIDLCSVMSVSGFEKRATLTLKDRLSKDFDEVRTDAVGNHVFIKRAKRANAPLCLIDAHFDEVGMMVTEICDGGFLKFAQIGGLSLSVLQGADVTVYGKKEIRGIIISTPPHLRAGDPDKLAEISELLIDTGYSKESLEELAPVGTPIGFSPCYSELLNGCIAGKSFDNKACAAVCAKAVADAIPEELECDVALMLSCFEETSRIGGVTPGVYALKPDYAMVVDVNLARVPDTPKSETVPLAEGISISISAATHRGLTFLSERLCKDKEIPHTMVASPMSTGTNATSVNLVGNGVPVVDIGLPLKNMHTYNEVISLEDAESLYRLVSEFIKDKKIAADFSCRGKELPL